jgi:hypothetical protein
VGGEAKVRKQPYFIHMRQEEPSLRVHDLALWEDGEWSEKEGWKGPKILMMAGLYDVWNSPQVSHTHQEPRLRTRANLSSRTLPSPTGGRCLQLYDPYHGLKSNSLMASQPNARHSRIPTAS